ncbi:hypothetical protein [Streptomyces orinoci]|uniref:Lipoprotein n=1 Tax=Streptomyces orinoci TaxID=67339 RepID=A0ABV3K6U8_STRON|nr:hypothetical protein [Streptomyces orinoci]
MRTSQRNVLIPALTIASLALAGCSSSGSAQSAAKDGGRTPSSSAPADEPQLAVAAAPAGAVVPSAVAHQADDASASSGASAAAPQAHKSSLKVASYDRRSGRAVIADGSQEGKKAKPSAKPPVAVGDVFASAPAPGAPNGVLAKVTKVGRKTEHGTEVGTAPANLNALLGEANAAGKAAVDPSAVKVQPLVSGVKVSWAKRGDLHFGPQGAQLPMGNLRLDVSTGLSTPEGAPASASATVAGFVQLAPEVDFSYDGRGTGGRAPGTASLALKGDWASQWELKGQASVSKPLRIPFAKLHATPVINVGPVPVVVNTDLTCYLQVEADGKVSVDVKQDVKGDFKVGGSYSRTAGWQPVNESKMSGSPIKASASGEGKVKASLGAEAEIGLYGTVGVSGEISPYLRAEGDVSINSDSRKPTGKWGAYGGIDVNGALQLKLAIFGTPLFERKLALPGIHKEWFLAGSRRA